MKVLAAVDFGDASLEALRQARALAHGLGAEFAACHVLPAPSEFASLFSDPASRESAELTGEEESAKKAIQAHARERLGLELSDVFVDRGSAYAEIVRRAENWGADYIAVGTHGRTGIARVVLGSVAERVARHAHCSVLVARTAEKSGVVLAATDLSETSLPAIRAAGAAAKRSGARLVVASALELNSLLPGSAAGLIGGIPAVPPPDLLSEMRRTLQSTIDQVLAREGVVGEALVLDGSPASAIVSAADELGAELVVVGTHGRTGLVRLALGSVAERVIRGAHCSVLAVRARSS